MAAISLFKDTNMAAVTSCENILYNQHIKVGVGGGGSKFIPPVV